MHSSSISTESDILPLNQLGAGQRARLTQINGDRQLSRRMLGLGLRRGVEVDIVQRRRNGVVIARGETRIALGTGVAEKIMAEPLEAAL